MEAVLMERRHGDVLIYSHAGFSIPKDAKLTKDTLIHKGTNNSHVISGGEVMMGDHSGKRYLRVVSPAIVSHVGGSATHESKPLPVGDYWTEIQTFYDHLTEESKRVID